MSSERLSQDRKKIEFQWVASERKHGRQTESSEETTWKKGVLQVIKMSITHSNHPLKSPIQPIHILEDLLQRLSLIHPVSPSPPQTFPSKSTSNLFILTDQEKKSKASPQQYPAPPPPSSAQKPEKKAVVLPLGLVLPYPGSRLTLSPFWVVPWKDIGGGGGGLTRERRDI